MKKAEELKTWLARTSLMIQAVTLHNIPEGMAVGIVYAGLHTASTKITAGAALEIAIQKFR